MTKKEIRKKMEMLLKSGKYMMKIGRLIFWDFGGQYVYYTTHQTFMTFRELFLVVFDGSVPLNKKVKDVICFPGHYGIPTAAVFLQHWVNSILTYCEPKYPGIPKILFVATHKNKVPGEALEDTRITLYNEIEELFRDHDGRNHLILEHQLFVNATDKNDPEINTLKQIITDLTFKHPCWGEKMPNMWVPLELEIAELSAEGKHILSLEEMKELNQASEVSVLSEEDLKFFLQVQHSLGKIVYFDTPQLRKFIIINPLFMIEVMKSFVTDEQFWPKDLKMRQPFTQMSMEGVILKRELFKVWEQPTFSNIFLHKEFVFEMLVHLDILSEQRHYDKETGNRLEVEEYFVPCMLTRRNTTNYMEFECTPSRAIGFAFVFKGTIIPPALPNRLISACLSMWYVKRYKGQTLLFSGFVVLSFNKSHDIVVCVESNSIMVYMVHKSSKGLIVSDIATEVRECLYNNLQRISEFYQSTVSRETSDKKLPFHLELACSDFTCYTPATAVLADEERLCAKHGNRVEVDVWYQKKPLEHCEGKCEGLSKDALDKIPSDSEILRLSTIFGSDMVREMAIHLGLKHFTWDDMNYAYPRDIDMVKFLILIKWRDMTNGTFKQVADALMKMRINFHILCQVRRIERRPTDIPEEHFDSVPTDEILDAMAPVIGRKSFQLGIELGQSVQDLEAIQHDYSNDLKAQTRQILYNWRNDRSVKATLSILQQALVNVERGTQCLKSIVDELGVKKHNFREQTKEKPAPTNLQKQRPISSDLFKKTRNADQPTE